MKKKWMRLLAGVLAAGLCFGTVGCGDRTAETQEESLVYLNYDTGIKEDGNYNSDLYGMNNNNFQGSDPCMIYVSEEEDPDYGGYYYMYPCGPDGTAKEYEEENINRVCFSCYRSKDMYRWEPCGALSGNIMAVDTEDWCQEHRWANSVIRNPADGKYYLYFNAVVPANYGVEGISNSSNPWDRFHLGVAVSDTPVGPYDVLYDTDPATGKRIPTINFHTGCGTQYPWAAIDAAPFFDEDGTLYLYFNKHTDDHYGHLNGVFGMKMKSMTIPDYTTVSCLTQNGYITGSNTPGNLEEISHGDPYYIADEGINEAPYMYKYNGKYYITYAAFGYNNPGYSVHQAVGDSPLGPFVKPSEEMGNPVMDGSQLGYMNGTASHGFMEKDGELWIVCHRHGSVNSFEEGLERSVFVDRVKMVTNKNGETVMSANGPTMSLQWLPESVSGYQNLAQKADVKISAGDGVQYLTDTVMPFYKVTEDYKMSVEGDVTITMKWPEPVNVASVMIYNSRNAETAYSKISDIRFKLAGQPSWASEAYDYAVIRDLVFPERYWNPDTEKYIACSPAVAEFGDLLITELSITIKKEDRLVAENKFGDDNTALNLSEIVVLGKEGTQ